MDMYDRYAFEKVEGPFGIPVYINNLPWIRGFGVMGIGVKVGSAADPFGKEGLAHFFEHIPFRGTRHFSEEDILNLKSRIFVDSLNAFTAKNLTLYYGEMLRNDYESGFQVLADLVVNPRLEECAYNKEWEVILREIREYFPTMVYEDVSKQKIYQLGIEKHPVLRASPIGWSDTFANNSLEEVWQFHKSYYHKKNIFVIAVGDIEIDDINVLMQRYLDELPDNGEQYHVKQEYPLPREKFIQISRFRDLKTSHDKDSFEVGSLLQQSKNERAHILFSSYFRECLSRKMRATENATYHVGRFCRLDGGHPTIGFTWNSDPGKTCLMKQVFYEELDRIVSGEMNEVFHDVKNVGIIRLQTNENRIINILKEGAHDASNYQKISSLTQEIEAARNITFEEVVKVAREFYDRHSMYLVTP